MGRVNHTPGPWFVVEHEIWFNIQNGPDYLDRNVLDSEDCINAEANAKLCAAAPDLLRAAVKAFAQLNAIRARDGVPFTRSGYKSDVQEEYFSSVVDELDAAVESATGLSAHCHPTLYEARR